MCAWSKAVIMRGMSDGREKVIMGNNVTHHPNPKNSPKMTVNRLFQVKMPKSKNCDIFDDETHTVNGTSWVVHQSRI